MFEHKFAFSLVVFCSQFHSDFFLNGFSNPFTAHSRPAMFFLQEIDLLTRHVDLKARKAVLVNRFSLSDRSFLIMRCALRLVNNLTLKSSF